MKIIQSFWTDSTDLAKITAGYQNLKFLLVSWALSSIRLSKYYPNLTLITDRVGKELLIDHLHLPYSEVHLDFDHFHSPFPSKIWTIKKLFSYTLFDESFIHVDGDVFLWKELPEEFLNAELVAQNADVNLSFYKHSLKEINECFPKVPGYMLPSNADIICSNAGIIGGRNHQFFKEFYQHVFDLLKDNSVALEKVNTRNLSTLLEQFVFNELAKSKKLPVSYLFPDPVTESNYPDFSQFTQLPGSCHYIHLMEAKSNYSICEKMCQRLLIEDKLMHDRIIHLVEDLTKHQVLEVDNEFNHHFGRTLISLSNLGIDTSCIKSSDDLSVIVNHIEDPAIQQRVEDVFFFETEKWNVTGNHTNNGILYDQYVHHSFEVNSNISKLGKENVFVKIRDHSCFIESSWNWCEQNEFQQHFRIDYQRNFQDSPLYYRTLLFVYHRPFVVKEYVLDPLSLLIFDALMDESRATIADIENHVHNVLIESNADITGMDLIGEIIAKLRFYLYQNVLAIE